MRVALEALELSSSGFTPGGLRAGGTTDLFIAGIEVATIRRMERWKVMETLDHYVQEATASLALIRLQPSVVRNLSRLKVGAKRFATPPDDHWNLFFHRDKQSSKCTSKLSAGWCAQRKR